MGYWIGPEIDPICGTGFVQDAIFVGNLCRTAFLQLRLTSRDYHRHHGLFGTLARGVDETDSLEIDVKVQ